MEKNTEKPIKAEIKDGKLVINGNREINLEGILMIAQYSPKELIDSIDDVIVSFARITCEMFRLLDGNDLEEMRGNQPYSSSIHYLKLLSDSLKKM